MKHKFLIVTVSIALAVALFTGVFAVMGWGSLLGDVGSAIVYPFQWLGSVVERGFRGFGQYMEDVDNLKAEIESLEAENESLKAELADAALLRDEHLWLYHYLSMKQEHTDYAMCGAAVISTTSADSTGGAFITELTLNKGSASGIEVGMPVVTPLGLVGVVVETGIAHCRVRTVLNTAVSVGAVTTRGGENGLCEGDYAHVHDGKSVLRYLPEEADVQTGDFVVTSGRGSVYPYGIPIGRVTEVSSNAFSRTTEAVVEPLVPFTSLKQVMILKSFQHYVDGYETGGESP